MVGLWFKQGQGLTYHSKTAVPASKRTQVFFGYLIGELRRCITAAAIIRSVLEAAHMGGQQDYGDHDMIDSLHYAPLRIG